MRVSLPSYFSLFLSILLFGLNSTFLFGQPPFPVTIDFTANTTEICEDESVTFTPTIVPTPQNFYPVEWTMGVETYRAYYNPISHLFSDAGVYPVSLEYQLDNLVRNDYVTVKENPKSSITSTNTTWDWVYQNNTAPYLEEERGYRTKTVNADIDSKGNAYVGGQWESNINYYENLYTNLTKIGKNGDVQWKIPAASQVAVDEFDNVFAVGSFTTTIVLPQNASRNDVFATNGFANITAIPNQNCSDFVVLNTENYNYGWFVAKYTSSGTLLWVRKIETENQASNVSVSVGGDKVYLVGANNSDLRAYDTNGSSIYLPYEQHKNTFIVEFDANLGDLHPNLHTISGIDFLYTNGYISTDQQGNLFLSSKTGYLQLPQIKFDDIVLSDYRYTQHIIIIKYKDDAIIYNKFINISDNGIVNGLQVAKQAVDKFGNLYYLFNNKIEYTSSWNIFGQTYGVGRGQYLMKIDPIGNLVWIRDIPSEIVEAFTTDDYQLFVFGDGKLHFYDVENGLPLSSPQIIVPSSENPILNDIIAAKNGVLYLGTTLNRPFTNFTIGSHTVTQGTTPQNFQYGIIAKYNYNQTLPQNGSVNLQATLQTGAPSVSYQWYKDGMLINGATSATYTANQLGFYQVETTTVQGCSRRSVGQYLSAPATFSVSDNEVCVGEPIILEATDLLGTNTQWNFGLDGSPNFIDAFTYQTGEIKQGVTYTQAGTKTITYQDGTTSLTENVTVRPLPVSSQLSMTNTTPAWELRDATSTFLFFAPSSIDSYYPERKIAIETEGSNVYYGENHSDFDMIGAPSGFVSLTESYISKRDINDDVVWSYKIDNASRIEKIISDKNGGVYVFLSATYSDPSYNLIINAANTTLELPIVFHDQANFTGWNARFYFVVKYDTDGNLLWAFQTDFTEMTVSQDALYLSSKNHLVNREILLKKNANSTIVWNPADNQDGMTIAKFSSSAQLEWTKTLTAFDTNTGLVTSIDDNNSTISKENLKCDSGGNLYFSAKVKSDSLRFDGNIYLQNCTPTYKGGTALFKISPSGQVLWTDVISNFGHSVLDVDGQDKLIIAGSTEYPFVPNNSTVFLTDIEMYSSEYGLITHHINAPSSVVIKYGQNTIDWYKKTSYDPVGGISAIQADKADNIWITPSFDFGNTPSSAQELFQLSATTGGIIQSVPIQHPEFTGTHIIRFDKLNQLHLAYSEYIFIPPGASGTGAYQARKAFVKKYGNNTCISEGTTISIQNTQPNTTYTWFKDGENTGNNGTSITITEEGTYSVEAENQFGCRQSSAGNHFSFFPEVQILPQQNPVIGYGSAVIEALAIPLGIDYEYQWQFNGVDIPNAISPILIANESGNYRVKVVSEDACEIISDVKEVQIRTRNGRATIINDSLNLIPNRATSATSTFSEGLDVDVNGGFVFEGGVFSNRLSFGSNGLVSRGQKDGYLVKRDTTGNILWNRSWGSLGDDQTSSVATTTEGEAIVGGYFNQTVTIGDTTLISKGQTDGVLIKYAANGDVVWAISTAGQQNDQITSIATDLGGHAIAAGFTTNTATVSTLRGDTTFTQTGENGFVIRYAPNGKLLWANQLVSPVSAKSTTVSTDIFGDVLVAGSFKTSLDATDENGTTLNLNGTTAELGFVAKYDEYGRLLWLKSVPKAAKGIDTDDFGNVFVVGEGFLHSFSPTGQSRFQETLPSNAIVSNIAVGNSGKIAISGHFTGTLNGNAATGNEEGFVMYFLPNGTLLDTQNQGGTQNDRINGVSFDELGNVYTTGFYENSMTLGENTLSNNGRAAVFTRFQPVLEGCGLDILAQNHTNTDFEWTQDGQNLGNGTTLSFSDGNGYLILDATENSFTTQDGVRIQSQSTFVDLGEDQNSCQAITLDAGNNGGNGFVRFEWYKDNVLITGQENQTLEVDEIGVYKVIAFNSQNCPATDEVNVNVAPLRVWMNIQNDTLVCVGSPIELRGFGADSYTYFKNNNPIGTGSSLTVLNAQNGDSFYVEGTRTSDNCTNVSLPIRVNTKTIPQINLGLNDRYFCPNDTLKLTANLTPSTNSNQYVFDWYRIAPNQTTGVRVGNGREILNVTQTGKYFVIVSNSANNVSCSRTSDTIRVNTYNLPVVSVSDAHVCDTTQRARLSASDISHGNTITYQWKNLRTGQNVGTDSILFVTNEDFYQVKVTNTSTGCSILDTAKAFFHTTPDFQIRGYENAICDRNDTLFIEATNLQNYSVQWFGNGIVSTVSTPLNQSIIINRSGIYTVIVTDRITGCSTTKTKEVIINQTPILSSLPQSFIQNPLVACQGDSLVLDAFDATHEPNAIYEWVRLSNRNAGTQTVSTSSKLTLTYEETLGLMPFVYQVKVSYPTTNCFVIKTVTVQFKRKSNVVATSNKTQICLGEKVNFEATGATVYRWNDGNTNATRTVQPDSVGTWTYIVEGKYDNGCSSSFDTIIVKVNPIPVAEIVEESIILCQNENLELNGFLPQHSATSRYIWTHVENRKVLSTDGELNISFENILPISYEPFTLRLTVVDIITNCESSDEVTVKFNRSSNVKIAENYAEKICIGEEITFEATGATSYYWRKLNDTSNLVLDSTNQITTRLDVAGFHTFIVEGNYQNGCNSTFDTVSIFVNPLPQIKAHTADSLNICAGNSVLLLPSSGVSYTWTHDPTAKDSISVSPTKSTTYYVIGTDENGCKNTDSVFVYVTPTFELPNLIQLCEGETITIGDTLSSDLNAVYEWLPTKDKTPFINVSKSGVYTVKVNVENCEFERSVEVQIKEKPIIELVADTVLCFEAGAEERFERSLSHTLGSVIANYDSSATYLYVWTSNVNGNEQIIGTKPNLEINEGGNYRLRVVARYGNNCEATDSILVTELCEPRIFIPEAFTPNNDNLNDYFEVFGKHAIDFEMQIFDRWGQIMYQINTSNIEDLSQTDFWDGTHKGKQVPTGAYVWVIRYSSPIDDTAKQTQKTGSFMIIR